MSDTAINTTQLKNYAPKARRDFIAAVSAQAADSAERYYHLAGGSVTVIPNPVDVDAVRAAACGGNEDVTVAACKSKLNLVCVGRMTAEKGHRDLISAVALADRRWPEDTPRLRLSLVSTAFCKASRSLIGAAPPR